VRHRSVFLVSSLVVAVVFGLFLLAPPFLTILEDKFYDLHFSLRGPRPVDEPVVIVAIDELSLAARGRWPWPRAILADLVTRISTAGPAAVAIDLLLSEPEVSAEARVAALIGDRIQRLPALAGTPWGRALERELDALVREADGDARLEAAIRASGRVVLPVVFEGPEQHRAPPMAPEPTGTPLPSALTRFRRYEERGAYWTPWARGVVTPIPHLAAAARTLGHVTMLPDADGSTRWETTVIEYRGHYYPSLAVQAVRVALGLPSTEVQLDFGRALHVGSLTLPLDPKNRALIDYAGPGRTFRHLSAAEVLEGVVPPDALRDRVVFVGATAEGTYDLRVTPTSPVLPGVEKHANVAAQLLAQRSLRRPDWAVLVEAAGIVLWPTLLAALLPHLRPAVSMAAVLLAWAAFFAGSHAAFRAGIWIPVVYPSLALVLSPVAITGYLYFTEERQRRDIKRAFQRFVSPEIVERVARDPSALQFGGEVRTLTVLFSDIRGFTNYTERHNPQELVQTLREFFTRMVEQILAHQGTLDKFIGDAIMAIFGAPLALPDHPERACRAALAMKAELAVLQAKWKAEGREPFDIGIGINTGEMVVGNLGSEQIFEYTVIGDAVNLGARLESLTREHQVSIIISETTYQAAADRLRVRPIGEVRVKGRAQSVVVYELLGLTDAAEEAGLPPTSAPRREPVASSREPGAAPGGPGSNGQATQPAIETAARRQEWNGASES
jgi:adenylate cyclase